MAVLGFDSYEILNIEYSLNYKEVDEELASLSLAHEFLTVDQNSFSVIIGTQNSEDFPFDYQVFLKGNFSYNPEEDDEKDPLGVEGVKANALAILYPYLRQTVSQLISLSGQPQLLLPTINMFEYLKTSKETKFEFS